MNYIYMLECGDKSLYTGWTTDIARRVAAHQSGKGAKYTRAHLPVTLVYTEEYVDKSTALRREIEIKALSREAKLLLIAQNPQKDCSL
ncbi:MAG: GIY-YIG nuclease family protein [Ruthenibacterium sp.]